jgi:hypothetical protein
MEHYIVTRIYCSHEKPFYLPYYVSDKMFVIEVARQYILWVHFFYEKRKGRLFQCHRELGKFC